MNPVLSASLAYGATFLCAVVGSRAAIKAPTFYRSLKRPNWAPPSRIFAPVWSILYIFMGTAAFLVFRNGTEASRPLSVALFLLQLTLNALWTWFFFAWRRGALALLDITILLAVIVAITMLFGTQNLIAGLLFVPYVAWVSFATALNLAVNRRNTEMLSG